MLGVPSRSVEMQNKGTYRYRSDDRGRMEQVIADTRDVLPMTLLGLAQFLTPSGSHGGEYCCAACCCCCAEVRGVLSPTFGVYNRHCTHSHTPHLLHRLQSTGHGLARFTRFLEWKVTLCNAANTKRTNLACVLSVRPQEASEARSVTSLIVPAQQPSPSDARSGHKISFCRLDKGEMNTRMGSCPG
jgi:hypothetical protein